MTEIVELFGKSTTSSVDWSTLVKSQICPFTDKKCFKTRKSASEVAIGTCSISRGSRSDSVVVCPSRFLQNNKIFFDCLHLLTNHEPGNEIHVIPEITIPGGSVDFVLVSARRGKVKDFAGIEIQSLDTTGSIWPVRQRFLAAKCPRMKVDVPPSKNCGINWKMTVKTILIQLNHKIATFEHLNKKLALVVQDCLFEYVSQEFDVAHLKKNPTVGDSMHFHIYESSYSPEDRRWNLQLTERFGTDSDGIKRCLGLRTNPCVELERVAGLLEAKISEKTLLRIG